MINSQVVSTDWIEDSLSAWIACGERCCRDQEPSPLSLAGSSSSRRSDRQTVGGGAAGCGPPGTRLRIAVGDGSCGTESSGDSHSVQCFGRVVADSADNPLGYYDAAEARRVDELAIRSFTGKVLA